MLGTRSPRLRQPSLQAPVRNHYFYGKLLDVYHFEMETQYHNAKRWLLNRLITGYGVVCGLNVEPGSEGDQIYIEPGVALDKWGREIIVERRHGPVTIPADLLDSNSAWPEQSGHEQEQSAEGYGSKPRNERAEWLYVTICYVECETDPMPVFAGDCDSAQLCATGTIRERFKVEFHRGRHRMPNPECLAPEFFPNDQLDYASLARFVSKGCPDVPDDPCVVLANIRIVEDQRGHGCERDNIDITVRPIVYSNDLLFKLLLNDDEEEREVHDYHEKG
jgi:hypothetical protein